VKCLKDWKHFLKPIQVNPEQKKKILKGKSDAYAGKIRLLNIFGRIPDSVWPVKHSEKLDLTDRSQHKVSQEHRNPTLQIYDYSTRNQNVRWKGAISMFPRDILEQLLDFYTERGEVFFDPFCVSGDTLISIPEGDVPIKTLVGKETYVYCCDGKELKLRKAWNIRKTRKNAKVIKITLDNEKELVITPNHKVMLLDGTWKEAKDLKENDSLMAFYRKKHKQSGKIVGVHKNTVGNISRNKFNYNHKVIKIEKLTEKIDVYNMEVEEFNNFIANGVVVHNCGHNSRMEVAYKKGRNYIGWDCSKEFMKFNRKVREHLLKDNPENLTIKLVEGDSRKIDEPDNSVDFIFSSPPYWNLEWYGDEPEQLGRLSYEDFMVGMTEVYAHCFRILKPGKFCIMNVNDFRKGGKYYSYHVDTVNALKSVGFEQFDHIILHYPNAMRKSFPNQIWKEKLMPKGHEHLLVFLKPDPTKKGAFPWLEK